MRIVFTLSFFVLTHVTASPAGLRIDTAEKAGLIPEKLAQATEMIQERVNNGAVGAAALLVARHGIIALEKSWGRSSRDPNSPPVRPDSVFLVASITKPVTATAVMKLVEQGRIKLEDPVSKYLPEFTGDGRETITVRHLLTHTCGLPDMLPEDKDLRKRHAPLKEFVAGAVRTPLLFPPGTKISYSSMGILLAAEIVQRTSSQSLEAFLQNQVFRPLAMKHSSLMLGRRKIDDVVRCQLSVSGAYTQTEQDSSWDWNSPYWRNLGAPWGGLHSTVRDIATLLQAMLDRGKPVLRPESVRAMITNQTGLERAWGLGWMTGPGSVFERSPAAIFGHSGATGTLCWADPERNLVVVIFTNQPRVNDKTQLLRRVSAAISEAAQP